MTTLDDLGYLDATAQAALVRDGEATPRELVDAGIARIEALNPTLNAVIHERFEPARSEAGDAALPDRPFRGVPFLVKDAVCHTAGDPYHCGMRVLKDAAWTEPDDSWLAARFRAAGFVFVGKSNLPELATSVTTEPLAYGATRNPWDLDRSPGGSSGGAAAAVASGMVPVAHGNDMGGSIRIPASVCGLVGLKPTRARSTLGPRFGEFWGPLTHEHVITRSVRDSAAVLDAIAGPGVGDPYTAPAPARPFAHEVGVEPGPLRIGVRTRIGRGGESHADCVAAVDATARVLESLGHHVEPVELPAFDEPGGAEAFGAVLTAAVARDVDRWSARLGRHLDLSELEPMNAALAEIGRAVAAAQYLAALEDMQAWGRRVSAFWSDHDLLLTPTIPEPPYRLGEFGPEATGAELGVRLASVVAFTVPFDVTGQPAISLPMHWNGDGLPIGVQLAGAYGREDVLLRVAAQLEAAQPWAHRRPPT